MIEGAKNSLTGSKGKSWSPLDRMAGGMGESPVKNNGTRPKKAPGVAGGADARRAKIKADIAAAQKRRAAEGKGAPSAADKEAAKKKAAAARQAHADRQKADRIKKYGNRFGDANPHNNPKRQG